MANRDPEFMIVAGEASGDTLGAELVKSIAAKKPGASFFGTPGPEMRAAGVASVFDSDGWSIVGIGAVARAVPRFVKILAELCRVAHQRKPSAVILVDFPEFNLKLARRLKRDGHKVIYYVSPQVWAWRKYRVRTVRNDIDLLLSILPFEKVWYLEQAIHHVKYVGNPAVSRVKPTCSKEEFCARLSLHTDQPLVALLPGSRQKEIRRHLPLMLEAAVKLRENHPAIQFVIAAPDPSSQRLIEDLLSQGPNLGPSVVEDATIDLLNAADAAAVSSGTATLEAGIIGTPMVVVYKLPKIDYVLFRPFVNTPHIGLINLIAEKRIVNELVQNDLTPDNLADEIERLLEPGVNEAIRSELRAAAESLSFGSPSENAADAILEFIGVDPVP